jgi:hypothetical protein
MISVARGSKGHLERRLCDLKELALEYKEKFNDAYKFHQFLKHLEVGGFRSKLFDEEPERQSKVIYIHQTDIEASFSDLNKQIRPIHGYVMGANLSELLTLAQQITSHHVEPAEEQHGLLTPITIHPPKG